MTDLQILARQTSNPSILKMQQRLHNEVIELGKRAMQWRESCQEMQAALSIERDAKESAEREVQELKDALKEVIKVLESEDPAIVDTVWVSTGQPETLRDHCHHAVYGYLCDGEERK